MISRKWDCTLTGRNLLFPYCDYKGSFQSLMNPMREKLKDVTLSFLPYWEFVISLNQYENSKNKRLWQISIRFRTGRR